MFEKEADEYIKANNLEWELECHRTSPIGEVKQAYLAGAEFGYNKANKWHYVKDGINPTHSYRVLVFTDEGVGFGIYGLDDKKWHTFDTGFDVIAWCEIPTFDKE